MEIAELRNPYDYANPVQDADLFAGRNESLAKISYLLDQAGLERPVTYVGLHGKRAAGKTSLLNMTEALARQRNYITVRVDLVADDSSSLNFFTKLYEELIGAVGEAIALKTPEGRIITPRLIRRITNDNTVSEGFPLEFPESVANSHRFSYPVSEMALRTDLEYLSSLCQRPIVLLIDEAQVIASEEHILSVLRTLGMRLHGYVFVIAGTTELVTTISDVFGHLLRQFELIAVERFAEMSEVMDCITRPLATLGLSISGHLASTASDLMALTDGNPYEIQLYCHVMFTRWQENAAELMALSTEAIDDVRLLLESGQQIQKNRLISAVRNMTFDKIIALNILCSSLGQATVDQIWFAHRLLRSAGATREQLNIYLNQFIEAEIVEIDDSHISFRGDLSEEIYTRVWTTTHVDQHNFPALDHRHHLELLSHASFRYVLSRNLDYLLCEINQETSTPPSLSLLHTCCLGMHPSHLERGLMELRTLPELKDAHFTVPYIYQAIVRCGLATSFDLITVTCSYENVKAVRWLYLAETDEFNLENNVTFSDAAKRVMELGGDLHSERTRIELKSWTELLKWISTTTSLEQRRAMTEQHLHASMDAYRNNDTKTTVTHLNAAYDLSQPWRAANNIAYIMLTRDNPEESLAWSEKALALPSTTKERALSGFNAAMASVRRKDYDSARSLLTEASDRMASVPFADMECPFLLLPDFREGTLSLREDSDVNLSEAITNAIELVDVVIRLRDIDPSVN